MRFFKQLADSGRTFEPRVRARPQMALTGVADLAEFFPNASMARTHMMGERGSTAPPTWPHDIAGSFTVFTYGNIAGQSPAADTYVVFTDSIALAAQSAVPTPGDLIIVQYLLPIPSFPRLLDLGTLPIQTTTTSVGTASMTGGQTVLGPGSTVPVSIFLEGTRIVLQWGDETSYERLYLGDVPIADTPFTERGLARYATTWGGGIDVEWEWRPRA
jgi:hypothetical protein